MVFFCAFILCPTKPCLDKMCIRDSIKAIHQENGGHGEAVNAGIRNATGLYFKVVDSDDWVNEEAYLSLIHI